MPRQQLLLAPADRTAGWRCRLQWWLMDHVWDRKPVQDYTGDLERLLVLGQAHRRVAMARHRLTSLSPSIY